MKYHIGLIGPGKFLEQVVSKMTTTAEDSRNIIAGVCVSDERNPDLNIPVYSDWREMIRICHLDFLVLLTDDRVLKKDIRENLPENIDLAEENPGKAGIINILAASVFRKKLNKKTQFLASLVEALPFPAITFNMFGIVTHWNSSCRQLTKVSGRSVIGKKEVGRAFYYEDRPLIGQMLLKDYSLSDYRQLFPDPDLDIAVKDNSVMVKGFMSFKSSMQGYYQVKSQKILLDGKVIGAIQLIQDLNALTFLQEEASRKQDALQSIVNHLPFPILQTSMDGSIIFTNRAGRDMLNQMVGEHEQDLPGNILDFSPEIREEFSSFIKSLSAVKEIAYAQEKQLNKTVYWKDTNWDITCLNPPGQNHELIWIIRNISLREKESQLHTALAMIGTICHEFSQPLTAVINSSQLLARTKPEDTERAARHQKIIDVQGERLFDIYKKLQNITQVRLQRYLDTQILDLEESTENREFKKRNENR